MALAPWHAPAFPIRPGLASEGTVVTSPGTVLLLVGTEKGGYLEWPVTPRTKPPGPERQATEYSGPGDGP